MTLDSAVIDIGDREFSLGLSYVAFSRVRNLANLALVKSYDFPRFTSIGQSRDLAFRLAEEARLQTIFL